mmetsp:Transcript_22302/g.59288  ORF Transcript_22302/g.59288 Transcript_22302/m.59288 type:complete len:175 (-) Transcript_22302:822-1346(-)
MDDADTIERQAILHLPLYFLCLRGMKTSWFLQYRFLHYSDKRGSLSQKQFWKMDHRLVVAAFQRLSSQPKDFGRRLMNWGLFGMPRKPARDKGYYTLFSSAPKCSTTSLSRRLVHDLSIVRPPCSTPCTETLRQDSIRCAAAVENTKKYPRYTHFPTVSISSITVGRTMFQYAW